jgi:TolA-binding protein
MSKGGFNFGNVGGNVTVEAGGDVVAGDKTTTTTTTIITGFKQEEDKQEFIQQVEELRKQLRQVKGEIEATEGIDEDEKDAIIMEVMQQVKALKTAKDEAGQLPIQQEPSQEKRDAIEAPLNGVNGIVSKECCFR